MPNTFNIAIVGMKETGKKTYAKMLNEKYGWTIVDVEKIIGEKIAEMKEWDNFVPSNADPRSNSIHP